MQNFKIVPYLLVGCTDSRGYDKFTPKYIIVGGIGGYQIFLKVADYEDLVDNRGFPYPLLRFQLGAVAKADQ